MTCACSVISTPTIVMTTEDVKGRQSVMIRLSAPKRLIRRPAYTIRIPMAIKTAAGRC